MRVIHSKPKGQRINCSTFKCSRGRVSVFFTLTCASEPSLLWCDKLNKWDIRENLPKEHWKSSHYSKPIRSVKAAIAHLKRHTEIPKGTKFMLESNFVGYDVYIIK